jgi:hypothetical protein
MNTIKCIISLFLLFLCIHTNAEDYSRGKLQTYIQNIFTFNHLYPQEKVYLHFDNTGYMLGETIWFKAYLVLAENHTSLQVSNVLYVELLTPEGDILETKKLKVENGQCHGEFVLKYDILRAGFYEIRAYTKAMLNFGEETVFSRVFPVFDKPKKAGEYKQKMTIRDDRERVPNQRKEAPKFKKLNLTFFPEGGNLIVGLPCNVAFKATDDKGRNVNIAGKIQDSDKQEICEFSTIHDGMGCFTLMPQKGKYGAIVNYNGKDYTFDLPSTLPTGYNMQVDNFRSDTMFVKIRKSAGLQNGDTLGITFTCRGKLYAFDTFVFDASDTYSLRTAKSIFPSGVVQISLFNAQGGVLSERLAYAAHPNPAKITTGGIRATYNPYNPVEIDFEVIDSSGMPLETTFSLSVGDAATKIPTNYKDNIQTYLLLSSDLRGYIENPGYYFESDDAEHRKSLDLLMMVQGWRRYEWRQMAGVKPFVVKHFIEKEIVIEGKVLSLYKGKPEENIEVTMWASSAKNQTSLQGKCITDREGKFNFTLGDLYGKWDLSLQTRQKGKRKQMSILLDRNISPAPKYFTSYENDLPEMFNKERIDETRMIEDKLPVNIDKVLPDDSVKSHLLQEVLVMEKKPLKTKDYGLAHAGIVYDVLAETDKILDRGEYFVEDVQDFLLRTNKYFSIYSTPQMDSLGKYTLRYKGRHVRYHVENMSIENTGWQQIQDIQMNDIESIMISEDSDFNRSLSSSLETVGNMKDYVDIFIYLRDKSRKSIAGIRNTSLTGFSLPAEFYHPVYNDFSLPPVDDFRRTLYWNPNVKTDQRGRVSVRFYNNNSCKGLDISAEGISKNGMTIKM